jgi:SAM-dependent methyltransferase
MLEPQNLARPTSYGRTAALYDTHRPAYPAALLDDLAALSPDEVLDIGCGTGMVAAALVDRGLSVLGVEPDEQMAAVARGHDISLEVAPFETWDDAGRQFDLLTCGAAWHWIDQARGTDKAAQVLRQGGTFARFYNFELPDEPAISALETVYRKLAPKLKTYVPVPRDDFPDPVATSDAFSAVETKIYPWSRTVTAEEWVGMVTTFSDHQRLGAGPLAGLQQAIRDAIETVGGSVTTSGGTYVLLAHRM